MPEQPKWLSRRGRFFWPLLLDEIEPMHIATKADAFALAMLADAMGEWKAAADADKRTACSDAMRRAMVLFGRFGLTPADRVRLTVTERAPADPFAELRERGKSG